MIARNDAKGARVQVCDSRAAAACHSASAWGLYCLESAALGDLLEQLCSAVEDGMPEDQRAPLLELIKQAQQRHAAQELQAEAALRAPYADVSPTRQRR